MKSTIFNSNIQLYSRSMTLYHVTHYVTTVTCLFIIQKEKEKKKNQKKRNIKSRKIDKKKRKEKY